MVASAAATRDHLPLRGRRPRPPLCPHPSSPDAPPVVGERLARKELRPGRYLSSRRDRTAAVAPGRREMPAPPSPVLCQGKKRVVSLNTRSRRGSATRQRPPQPIGRRRAGRASDVAGGTDVSPPGPGAQPTAPKDGGGGASGAGKRRGKPARPCACVLPGPRPLPRRRAPPSSRESGSCVSEPAAVFTFCHGAEGGDGRGRRCEGSAQAGPPLASLGGNIETNHNLPPSHKSRNNILRTSLDLYANVIHCKSLPGVVTRHRDIDILIVRENTEGEYSSLEHESVAGVVESLKIITKAKSLRIAEYAFQLAQESGRKKVTAVHKANIMKLGDGLFLQCCREVAARYPQITFENMIVDNTTMQLVSRPQQFDVMVMPNLYGNIVNNVCAGLVGGPGLVAGANYGHVYAVFETATRNTGKSIANKNIANPTATLLASCMMLDHLKLHSYATSIRKAVLASMDNENMHTPDIGGQGTTSEAIQDIIRHIRVINGRAVEA
uniref:Isocitrate dehydrogenase [NAD] subunit, mitochondrial n=1 Tax=Bos mutus grunniens TaxID=30521 RepID=A0A8B9YFU6_BOSMU